MSAKIRTVFPKSKIKQIMQMDDDVGKIAADVPVMISRSVELFLEELLQSAISVAKTRESDVIQAGHLKECILQSQQFDFLKPMVEQVTDLAEKQEKSTKTPKNPKPKKARTSNANNKPSKQEAKKETEPAAEAQSSSDVQCISNIDADDVARAPDALELMGPADNDDEDWDD